MNNTNMNSKYCYRFTDKKKLGGGKERMASVKVYTKTGVYVGGYSWGYLYKQPSMRAEQVGTMINTLIREFELSKVFSKMERATV